MHRSMSGDPSARRIIQLRRLLTPSVSLFKTSGLSTQPGDVNSFSEYNIISSFSDATGA